MLAAQAPTALLDAFPTRHGEQGYAEGQDDVLELALRRGRDERLPDLAEELVRSEGRRHPDERPARPSAPPGTRQDDPDRLCRRRAIRGGGARRQPGAPGGNVTGADHYRRGRSRQAAASCSRRRSRAVPRGRHMESVLRRRPVRAAGGRGAGVGLGCRSCPVSSPDDLTGPVAPPSPAAPTASCCDGRRFSHPCHRSWPSRPRAACRDIRGDRLSRVRAV